MAAARRGSAGTQTTLRSGQPSPRGDRWRFFRHLVTLFYRNGMTLTVMGLALGLPTSIGGAYMLEAASDIGVQGRPSMLLVGGGVGGVMLAVASVATLFPAAKAATVDPMLVLRSE